MDQSICGCSIKSLGEGEEVSQLFRRWNKVNGDLSLFSVIAEKMIPNFDMLRFGVLNRVLCYGDSTRVIAEDGSVGELVSIIQQLILNPKNLSAAAIGDDVFGFSGGDGY